MLGRDRFGVFRPVPPPDAYRRQMIRETEAFLTWALSQDRGDLPRIPVRRADRGGFKWVAKHRGAKALVVHWWRQALNKLG